MRRLCQHNLVVNVNRYQGSKSYHRPENGHHDHFTKVNILYNGTSFEPMNRYVTIREFNKLRGN